MGYRRDDGRVGVRNHVAVTPTPVAASSVARGIADGVGAWGKATPHQMGTTRPPETRSQTERVLAGIGQNPNVGAALVVELGTEETDAADLADRIARNGTPVDTLSIRDVGGTSAALEAGTATLDELNEEASTARREEADANELVFAAECGGSDATSGIAANPAVGKACDRLVRDGGTASFSETPEFIGDHAIDEAVEYGARASASGVSLVDARTADPTDLVAAVRDVADGAATCAEGHGLTEFAITRVGPSM
ncbi:hypothetical protein GCM10009037_26970 [Halarchaeum grantii]|uniref:D-galactarate/Altronate dehydratase C-terminal domain-containing protein n=1 Tax=Halarchaeum grantii TaxID=1193105 RepID=A0A830F5T2_9EURY|nr:UxaA family hydrolase [Halarchaeum grantii]GGL42056.1 hypothetical protein GCM10009037_26970 [Halarchaeum grantii]